MGESHSSNFFRQGNITNRYNSGEFDGLISKFDLNGNLLWGTLFGGNDDDVITDILITDENTFYISGAAYSSENITTPGSHRENFYILSDQYTYMFSYIAKFGNLASLSAIDIFSNKLNIYPNPIQDKVYIQGFIHKDSLIEVYNLVGQKIVSQKVKSGLSQEIDVQFLPKGTYIIKVIDINGKPFQEILIKK